MSICELRWPKAVMKFTCGGLWLKPSRVNELRESSSKSLWQQGPALHRSSYLVVRPSRKERFIMRTKDFYSLRNWNLQ